MEGSRPFDLEPLEARVLLSGDGLIAPEPAGVSGGDASVEQAEARTPERGADWTSLEAGNSESVLEGETLPPLADSPPDNTQGVGAAGDSDSDSEPVGARGFSGSTEVQVASLGSAAPDVTTQGLSQDAEFPSVTADRAVTSPEILVETLRAAHGPPLGEDEVDDDSDSDSEGDGGIRVGEPQALLPKTLPDRPMLVLHGIGGSFPSLADYNDWLRQRGFHPTRLETDPLTVGYEDLVLTLVATGYVRGQDLFEANYDWRVTPGPTDLLIDGQLDNADGTPITADQITDDEFGHGIDYFGYWVSRAALEWAARHENTLPAAVDVVAHSTGGLVVRAYIQSDAYGGDATITAGKLANGLEVPAGTKTADGLPVSTKLPLPKVNDLVTMGVPMRGAPGPFQLSQNDWGAETAYVILGKVMAAAYEMYFAGVTLEGPGNTDIPGYTGPDFLSAKEFTDLYCPTLVSLTGTYLFIFDDPAHNVPSLYLEGGVEGPFNESSLANRLVLDLNDGLDLIYPATLLDSTWSYVEGPAELNPGQVHRPTGFIDLITGEMTVIYSATEETASALTRRVGPAGAFEFGDYDVTPFCDYVANNPAAGETWYISNQAEGSPAAGDGSVPIESSFGLYSEIGVNPDRDPNPRLHLVALPKVDGENHSHTGMLASPTGLRALLEALNRTFGANGENTDLYIAEGHQTNGSALLSFTKRSYQCSPPPPPPPSPAGERSELAGVDLHLPPDSPVATFTSTQLGAIADGLVSLKGIVLGGFQAATSELEAEIALLGRSLGDGSLVPSTFVDSTFTSAAAAVRALPAGSDALDLMDVLTANGLLGVGGLIHGTDTSLILALTLARSDISESPLALGDGAVELGIDLASAPMLELTDYFALSATIEIDTTMPVDDVFGVVDYSASQGIYVEGAELEGVATMGTAGDTPVTGGGVQVNAYANQRFSDSSGDNRLTGAELAAASVESISSISGKGSASAALPTGTADGKIIYASAARPFGVEADVVVGSLNFELIKDRLRELLDGLAEVGDALENPIVQTALLIPLPFLDDPNNNTLDELLTDDRYGFGLGEFFDLVDVLRKYCDEVARPDLAGFVEWLAEALRFRLGEGADGELAQGPISIRGGFDVDSDDFALVVEIGMEKTFETELTEAGFGPEANGLGLDLSIPVEARLGLDAEFTLGMSLSGFLSNTGAGLSKADVFLNFNRLQTTLDLSATNIDTPVTLGFLTAGIANGSATLSTAVNFTVNSGNPVSLVQLESVLATSLVSLTPSPVGNLLVTLPLTATVGGTDLTAGCSPTITISDANVFDGTSPTVSTADFDCLRDFCNITPTQVLGMLKGLADWLEQFRDAPAFQASVPFTSGTTFGDLFDFSQAFVDKVYNQLVRREIVGTGAQSESAANRGRLASDAKFELQIDDLAAVGVTVKASDAASNSSLEELAATFNAALTVAGLGASVEAAIGEGRRLALRLKPTASASGLKLIVPDPDGTSATPNTDAMVAELGFGEIQYAVETPNYDGLEDFSDQLSEALADGGVPLDVNLVWDTGLKEIRLEVDFRQNTAWTADFNFDPDLGLGPLADAEASGTFTFAADIHAGFVLGFDPECLGDATDPDQRADSPAIERGPDPGRAFHPETGRHPARHHGVEGRVERFAGGSGGRHQRPVHGGERPEGPGHRPGGGQRHPAGGPRRGRGRRRRVGRR